MTSDTPERIKLLASKIDELRMTIATDAFPMSIGELSNLYRDGELNVHPEFQRAFRWSVSQKSRLIESILLGIPLPSIFVAQDEDGKWDVVDGVQRLSTILQFMGLLTDEDGEILEPLRCTPATYLREELDGVTFDDQGDGHCLTTAHKLDFKRSRLDIQIIKRQSSPRGKFDLFQRLNSYGSPATAQELRNALLLAANRDAYKWLEDLANFPAFRSVTDFSGKNLEEKYHMDVALRFAVFRIMPVEGLSEIKDNIHEFLSERAVEIAERDSAWFEAEAQVFRDTFTALEAAGGPDILRRYNSARGRSDGGFSLTAFEVVALGLGYNWGRVTFTPEQIWQRFIEFWSKPEYSKGFATGLSAVNRMKRSLPIGRSLFEGE
ncbi:DUF262 domain-containing protein [Plantactinospora endophytica]|uniref:DUF262 domain-containing protein n=1 Tax=Plantactinospora endophytica TaxID=673535 RepID=UPI001EF19BBE|nr:DUF262 domain-containing protein [Plantactinospora endophytica]